MIRYTTGKWEVRYDSGIAEIYCNDYLIAEIDPNKRDDIISQANAERICQCVNGWDDRSRQIAELAESVEKLREDVLRVESSRDTLLKACKRDEELANAAILATPTGEYRNKLTEINILRLEAIAAATE